MSKKITIEPGNDKKRYLLYEHNFKIEAMFIKWSDVRKVDAATFFIEPKEEYTIADVYFCAERDQLEISILSEEGKGVFMKKFDNLYFNEGKKEDVVTIRFYEGETYEEIRCFSVTDDQPERRKGNILVGG
ncbi:MAG: hypothetical protein AAF617_17020 [Bacteroidota bacterium]